MSNTIKFSNNGGKLNLNYLSSSKFVSVNEQNQFVSKSIVELNDLDEPIQIKLDKIDPIQSNISLIGTNVTSLQTQLSSNSTAITSLQNAISSMSNSGNVSDAVGISLDDAVVDIAFMSSNLNESFCKEWNDCNDSNAGASSTNICSMCCSGTGNIVLVPKFSVGSHRISTNYGKTWSNVNIPTPYVYRCSASLDGKYILVNEAVGSLYMSSNYGSSFSYVSGVSSVYDVAVSATGKYIIVGTNNNTIKISSNSGASWISSSQTSSVSSVCMAIDGTVMYAASEHIILKSVNYGANWVEIFNNSDKTIRSICCSGDGQHLLICYTGNNVLSISHDFGLTYSDVGESAEYYKIAMSSNGLSIACSTTNSTTLYYSINGGQTWSQKTGMSSGNGALAMSYNGEIVYHCAPYTNVSYNNSNSIILNLTAPSRPSSGSVYFNSSNSTLNVYDGSNWKKVTLSI